MPLYRTNQTCFIEPNLYKEGVLIDYSGPPGPHLDPVDDAAKEAMAEWAAAHPDHTLTPVENLPMTMLPTATVVEETSAAEVPVLTSTDAALAKAQPGLANGGKAQ